MKRFLPILFVLPLLLAACENVLPSEGVDLTVLTETPINTEPILYEGKVVDTDNFVSATALNAYLELQPNRLGNPKSVKSIEPAGPNADVTLMYVVNYEGGGWEIISADKRTEPILAHSSSGSFSWEKANPGEIAWMEGIGVGILNLRTAGKDAALTRSANENAQQNINFWDGLVLTKAFIDKNGKDALKDAVEVSHEEMSQILASQQTRSNDEGYYRLVSSVQTEVVADSLPHLTVTKWHQGHPWNYYCPGTGFNHYPVGCVAVAGAQMLYFLHHNIGYPRYARLDLSFYEDFPHLDDVSVWNSMSHEADFVFLGSQSVARLMYDVGVRAGMVYGQNESNASTASLPSLVFDIYNINCTCSNYDSSVIIDALNNDMMPSIVRADRTVTYNWLGNPSYSNGHSFIIDGYKRCRIDTINTYEWVYTNFDPWQISIAKPRLTETINGSPYVKHISMNWGWNDDNDNTWYLPDSDWVTLGGHNYKYARKMVTGFCKK